MTRFKDAWFSLRQIMGQTETSILLWASEEDAVREPGSLGRPVFHAEVKIVDRQGRPCGPGQVGKIIVWGSIMMTEYWQDAVFFEEDFPRTALGKVRKNILKQEYLEKKKE
jgi:fatty-acyl-CoA synthase